MREDALPQPVSPYGVTKLAAEQLCYLYFVNHGVPATSVRYFTVYGPRQRPDMAFHRFIRAALNGEPITLYGDGEQTRDFTFVADAVAATIAAGERGVPGRAYNIGGGSRVSVNHVLEIIDRLAGRPLDVRREPAQKGDMRDTYADTSLARADLGFAPQVSLEEGIEAEYRWLVDHTGAAHDGRALVGSSGLAASRRVSGAARILVLACAAACASGPKKPPAGTLEPDKFLCERGTEELNEKHWLTAREYFRQLVDSYPQSPYRADAKLGIGDTLSRRRHGRSATCWRSTSSGSSCPSTRRTSAPTTRSSSWRCRTSTRCAARCATRPRRARRSAS